MPFSTPSNTWDIRIPDDVGTLHTMTLKGFNGRIPGGVASTLTTFIIHSYCDLILTLTSPKGTRIVLVYRIGNQRQNIYNGTVWSDAVEYEVGDYLNNLPTQAKPQTGVFADFAGENPMACGPSLLRMLTSRILDFSMGSASTSPTSASSPASFTLHFFFW